jgi:hypothetical protein
MTYRLELLCDAVKTLRLARPAAAATSALLRRACSTCAVGGSSVIQPPSAGATFGRLRGLRTKVGAASSSSSSSSTTRRSRQRLGTQLPEAEPWPVKGPRAAPAGATLAWDDPMAIGLLPATLSSVVGVGQLSSLAPRMCFPQRPPSGGKKRCTGNTEQRCPPKDLLRSGAPCRALMIHTLSPGQCLRSANQRR